MLRCQLFIPKHMQHQDPMCGECEYECRFHNDVDNQVVQCADGYIWSKAPTDEEQGNFFRCRQCMLPPGRCDFEVIPKPQVPDNTNEVELYKIVLQRLVNMCDRAGVGDEWLALAEARALLK